MAEIVFSPHAQLQLTERNISEGEILEVMGNPIKVARQPNGRFQALKMRELEGRKYLLTVVYEEVGPVQEIVTAFYTSKIHKYLWNFIMIKK